MNNAELEQNFLWACIKYAVDNGGVDNYYLFPQTIIGLTIIDGLYTITYWSHSSPQPTNDDLKAYTVAECEDIEHLYYDFEYVTLGKPLDTLDFNIVKDASNPGQFIYDKTVNQLKFKLSDNSWINI